MSKSIYEKLRTIPEGYLGILTVIFILIPVIYPMGLPLIVTETTKGYYQAITDLPEGSIICIDNGANFGSWDEFEAAMTATLRVLLNSDVKWFSWGYGMDGNVVMDVILKKINAEQYGKVYGEDYILLPYLAGMEMAVATIASDTHTAFTKDFYGNDLSQYPLWDELTGAENYDLAITITSNSMTMDIEARQWFTAHGIQIIEINISSTAPMSMKYYPDVLPGGLWGAKGGTEMELLSGYPGPGARISDSQNLGLLPFIVFLILGNVGYLGTKYSSRKEEE